MSKSKRDKLREFLTIEDGAACVFCAIQDETLVKHHIRLNGLCGMGMKPPNIFTMPVCWTDHAHCHSGMHSMAMQKEKLLEYWFERLIQKYGEQESWRLMGGIMKGLLI